MKKSCISCFLGIACWLMSQPTMADIEYSYFEVGYEDLELDLGSFDVDGDGFYLGGSYAVQENVFVFGGYRDYDLDPAVDLALAEVGLGVHSSRSETFHLVGTVGYFIGELETNAGDDNDDGFDVRMGLRAEPARNFEYELFVGYRNIDAYKANASAALRLKFTPNFSVHAGAVVGADITLVGAGLRFGLPR